LTHRHRRSACTARLKIIAEFPDGKIDISQFQQKTRVKARACG